MPIGQAKFGLLGGVADLGKLELIETQTISGAGAIDFLDLQESTYNVHLLTVNDFGTNSGFDSLSVRVSDDGGTTFESSNYQRALQYGQADGTFGELRTTSATSFDNLSGNVAGTNQRANGYIYFYNLGDNTKYSFITSHTGTSIYNTLVYQMRFGSCVYTVASTINALRVDGDSFGGTANSGTLSLYGIAES